MSDTGPMGLLFSWAISCKCIINYYVIVFVLSGYTTDNPLCQNIYDMLETASCATYGDLRSVCMSERDT